MVLIWIFIKTMLLLVLIFIETNVFRKN